MSPRRAEVSKVKWEHWKRESAAQLGHLVLAVFEYEGRWRMALDSGSDASAPALRAKTDAGARREAIRWARKELTRALRDLDALEEGEG